MILLKIFRTMNDLVWYCWYLITVGRFFLSFSNSFFFPKFTLKVIKVVEGFLWFESLW